MKLPRSHVSALLLWPSLKTKLEPVHNPRVAWQTRRRWYQLPRETVDDIFRLLGFLLVSPTQSAKILILSFLNYLQTPRAASEYRSTLVLSLSACTGHPTIGEVSPLSKSLSSCIGPPNGGVAFPLSKYCHALNHVQAHHIVSRLSFI